MRIRLAALAMLAMFAVPQTGASAALQPSLPAARGTEAERMAIVRILAADNLDTTTLSSRQIAQRIRAISRGRAPRDFWNAYRAHVRAWQRFAAAEERVQRLGQGPGAERAFAAMVEAEGAVETTFSTVLRIAGSYGVEPPVPPGLDEATI
jgi:hypothetical protein